MLNKTLRRSLILLVLALGVSSLAPVAAQARFGDRALNKGNSGREVRVLQRWLTLIGFTTKVDGNFGRQTVRSLRRFEASEDLPVDGRLSRGDAADLRVAAYAAARRATTTGPSASPRAAAEPGAEATMSSDGRTAIAPDAAPQAVKDAIAAANAITAMPYRYGGGHGSFDDSGYDCSGAVSYALHGAGLLDTPLDSSGLAAWGESGEGQWITVYGKSSHAYIVIAGLRFDTSGSGEKGPRWRTDTRTPSGYAVRHPTGL